MSMTKDVTSLEDAKRQRTLDLYESLRVESTNIMAGKHFKDQQDNRFSHLPLRQLVRAVQHGEVVKVGPGKYNNWKVEVKYVLAGETVIVVCDVSDDRLYLITCMGGSEDVIDE